EYYRLFADDYYDDQDIIQMSALAVTGNIPGSGEEAAPVELEVDGEPAPAAPPPVAAAPGPAPSTADPISIAIIGVLASATGVLFVKKRTK
ncbi:MAG: hypothetical protein FWH24_03580, partial [Oscillospiraceae bacterium]|nr:hypothetical protein [Oscillospiraceae bacterium]